VDGSRGGVDRVDSGLRLLFRHNVTGVVPKEPSVVFKPYYKAKQAFQ